MAAHPPSPLVPSPCCVLWWGRLHSPCASNNRVLWVWRACASEAGEGRPGPSLRYNQPHTAAHTSKYCRNKPHNFHKVRLPWAYVYIPADTLSKMYHHNCLSISHTTPFTFSDTLLKCPLTIMARVSGTTIGVFFYQYHKWFKHFPSPVSLSAVSGLSLPSIFIHIVWVYVFQQKLFIHAHKSVWAYKTECCSGKKHINTHTSEAEIQLWRAVQLSVTNYF